MAKPNSDFFALSFCANPLARGLGAPHCLRAVATIKDSTTAGAVAGFSYRSSDSLKLGLIVGAFSNIEDSVSLLPIPTVDWDFADDWAFHMGLVTAVDPGAGIEISYQMGDSMKLGLGASYQNRRFRLDDGDAVGQERSAPIFAIVGWNPTKKISLNLLAGVSVSGQLRLEDDDGDKLAKDDYDPAPFVGLKGQVLF